MHIHRKIAEGSLYYGYLFDRSWLIMTLVNRQTVGL